MVSGVDNHVASAQASGSVGKAEPNTGSQQVASAQTVALHVERKSDKDLYLRENEAKSMVESLNNVLVGADSQLKFVLHDELNEYYVTIINSTTDEVIREIPSKKLLDIHAAMKEFVGLLVDRKI